MRERKNSVVIAQFSRREKLALVWLSDARGESMSNVLRVLVREAATAAGIWPTANDALTDGLGFMPRPETKPAGPEELAELEAAAAAETKRK